MQASKQKRAYERPVLTEKGRLEKIVAASPAPPPLGGGGGGIL